MSYSFKNCIGIEKVAFAPCKSSPSFLNPPLILDIETRTLRNVLRNKTKQPLPIDSLSQFESDAFCVEYFGNSIVYGHRNGTISILDERSGILTHSLYSAFNFNQKKQRRANIYGSISSLRVIDNDESFLSCPFSIVAGTSFGACVQHDLRRTGFRYEKKQSLCDSSLVRQMEIPSFENLDQNSSTQCRGIAISPDKKTCVLPYISNTSSKRLGMWSLVSGRYVGSFPIGVPVTGESCTSENYPIAPYCELSETVTPAWEIKQRYSCNERTRANISCSVSKKPNSWGLWLKCGNETKVESSSSCHFPPNEIGAIHHVTFPGSIDTR